MKVYNKYMKDKDLSNLSSSASSTTTKTKKTKKRKQEYGPEQSSKEEGAAQVNSSTPSSEYRRVTLECSGQEEDVSPPRVTPSSTSTSLESVDELGPFILGNDLNGFSYLPATKF